MLIIHDHYVFSINEMNINILKSKLHRATITDVHLRLYEGSCAIDENLLQAAGIHEFEMIHIYNLIMEIDSAPMLSKQKKTQELLL